MIQLISKENVHNDLLYKWHLDPEYKYFFNSIVCAKYEDLVRFFNDENSLSWIIVSEKDIQETMGIVCIRNINQVLRYGEVHLLMDKFYQLKGFAVLAMVEALKIWFDRLNMKKISALLVDKNKRALDSCKRFGFIEEAVLKNEAFMDGELRDLIKLSIIRG